MQMSRCKVCTGAAGFTAIITLRNAFRKSSVCVALVLLSRLYKCCKLSNVHWFPSGFPCEVLPFRPFTYLIQKNETRTPWYTVSQRLLTTAEHHLESSRNRFRNDFHSWEYIFNSINPGQCHTCAWYRNWWVYVCCFFRWPKGRCSRIIVSQDLLA